MERIIFSLKCPLLSYRAASKFFRQAGEDEQAQRTLYGAAESFDAAGLKKDAASSAELLKELYPDSKYAEDAEVFIK